jgi:hypothetical protein
MLTNPLIELRRVRSIHSGDENHIEMCDKHSQNDSLELNTTINDDTTLEFPDFWIKLAGLELKPEGLWKFPWYFWRIIIVGNFIKYFIVDDLVYSQDTPSRTIKETILIPLLLSQISLFVAFSVLPRIINDLRSVKMNIYINQSMTLSKLYFFTMSLLLLLSYTFLLCINGTKSKIIYHSILYIFQNMSVVIGLTFTIFCMSLDTLDCQHSIHICKLSAKKYSITLKEYLCVVISMRNVKNGSIAIMR